MYVSFCADVCGSVSTCVSVRPSVGGGREGVWVQPVPEPEGDHHFEACVARKRGPWLPVPVGTRVRDLRLADPQPPATPTLGRTSETRSELRLED